ncbi:MAG: phenylalanine--tRNA ligase subunit beta, partial [Prevotella nanceiensis]|nr:phenylalanine--tRNA ligase subunit beta [Hoylesella nanceiensis]
HCFDADMVAGHKIVVTTQPEGTKFITLDGEEHNLSERDLSICNANEAMCIAGIFGGKGSGTYENTRNIVLESAYFHPTWIRKSARRHGLSTDASYRFERGIDPNGQVYALKQAAILCKELAGGQVSMQIKDVYPEPIEGSKVVLTYDYVNSLIGKEIGKDTIKSIVTSLDMKIEAENENQIEILVPAYRVDVKRPCDVVEDILRIYGYNNVEIPLQLKGTLTIPTDEDRNRKYINLISEQLVGGGFNEILNNSLTKVSYYKDLNCYTEETTVKILNPLSADLGVMRQTLLFGGLESIVRNANRKNSNLRFFEFGNCYHYDESKKEADKLIKAYTQDQHLGLWVTGKRVENSWAHPNEDASFYELKAYVENILVRLGLSLQAVTLVKGENNIFEDSISIVTKAGKIIAELGIVAYKLTKNMGITNEVFFADIYWDNLLKAVKKHVVEYKEISKYPAVSRDLALLVDKTVEFEQIKEIAYSTEKKLLKAVELFDVYEGKNLPEGKKSYAVNFILQDEQKTLNDKQIDSIMKKLIDNLTKRLNAELR